MGYDIDYGYIFDDEIIEQSVRSDSKTPRASMGTMRRNLKNVANELNPDFDGPRMYHRYERSEPNPPHTDKEVHDIWQWAQVKNNGKRTQMKRLIVACGLGAGLTASEAGHLRYGDIEIDDLGVQLHLPEEPCQCLQNGTLHLGIVGLTHIGRVSSSFTHVRQEGTVLSPKA